MSTGHGVHCHTLSTIILTLARAGLFCFLVCYWTFSQECSSNCSKLFISRNWKELQFMMEGLKTLLYNRQYSHGEWVKNWFFWKLEKHVAEPENLYPSVKALRNNQRKRATNHWHTIIIELDGDHYLRQFKEVLNQFNFTIIELAVYEIDGNCCSRTVSMIVLLCVLPTGCKSHLASWKMRNMHNFLQCITTLIHLIVDDQKLEFP